MAMRDLPRALDASQAECRAVPKRNRLGLSCTRHFHCHARVVEREVALLGDDRVAEAELDGAVESREPRSDSFDGAVWRIRPLLQWRRERERTPTPGGAAAEPAKR